MGMARKKWTRINAWYVSQSNGPGVEEEAKLKDGILILFHGYHNWDVQELAEAVVHENLFPLLMERFNILPFESRKVRIDLGGTMIDLVVPSSSSGPAGRFGV